MTGLDPRRWPGFAALGRLAAVVEADSTLPAGLRELVKLRCSQLNGCAFCVRLHSANSDETEERLENLESWRTHPAFSERERAAFALAEAVTLVHEDQVPQNVLDAAVGLFGEAATMELIWIATVVNSYNRLAISTRFG